MTKLSLLLPSSLPTSIPSTLTTVVSIFLVSLVLLRVMVFEGQFTTLSQSQVGPFPSFFPPFTLPTSLSLSLGRRVKKEEEGGVLGREAVL